VAGEPIAFAAEIDKVASNIDHFWITIRISETGSLRIALSTHSRLSAAAGFDPRMRVGMIASEWGELPAAGLLMCAGLDYQEIEAATPVTYIEYERRRWKPCSWKRQAAPSSSRLGVSCTFAIISESTRCTAGARVAA
jgi:hypothetical protein